MVPVIIAGIVFTVLGFALGWMLAGSRLREELAAERARNELGQDKNEWTEKAEAQLRETFQALAAKSLQNNAEAFITQSREQLDSMVKQLRGDWSTQKEQFSNLVQPVERGLKSLDEHVRQLEQKREGAYKALEQHIGELKHAHSELRDATGHLRSALTTSSSIRGQWGELQLRRVVEMSGMLNHVDFEEQQQAGQTRPDMTVRMPNKGVLPVDAKTSLQDYLRAVESEDAGTRKAALKAHALAMRAHVRSLASKEYWKQFERTPDVVVMFVPNEACLSAAFEEDGELIEYALEHQVLLVTPVMLFGLLKAIAYGWQQQVVTENARLIANQGRELHERLATFLSHLGKTGQNLERAVKAYNDAIGSAESRVMPAARRLRELGSANQDLESPQPVELQTRLPAHSGGNDEEVSA